MCDTVNHMDRTFAHQRLDASGRAACELCGRRLNTLKWKHRYGAGYACHPQCKIKQPQSNQKSGDSLSTAHGIDGLAALVSATSASIAAASIQQPKMGNSDDESSSASSAPSSSERTTSAREIFEAWQSRTATASTRRSQVREAGQALLCRVADMPARFATYPAANEDSPSVQLAAQIREYIKDIPLTSLRYGIPMWDLIQLAEHDSKAFELKRSIETLVGSTFVGSSWLPTGFRLSTITIMEQECGHRGQPVHFDSNVGHNRSIILYCSPGKGTECMKLRAAEMDDIFQEYDKAAKAEASVNRSTADRLLISSDYHRWTANPGDVAIFEHTVAHRAPPHGWPFIAPRVIAVVLASLIAGTKQEHKQVVIGEMAQAP